MSDDKPGSEGTDGSAEPESAADALIDELRTEDGEAGEAEAFTLDRDVARRRLREYQLPDARQYVLKLAEAGVAQGATKIRFDIDADDMRVSFDGDPFSLEDFEHLYSALFVKAGAEPEGGQHALAIGLNAAMSLPPELIHVRSGDGETGAELRLRPDFDDEFRAAEGDAVVEGTRIHVKSPWSAELLTRVQENVRGKLPEEEILRERCRYASVEIDLEGKRLSAGPRLESVVVSADIEGDGVTGHAGFDPALADRSEVRFLKGGIWLATHRLGGLPDGFVALVEGTHLRLDLSQVELIRDEHFDAALKLVEAARQDCIEQLATAVTGPKVPKGLDVQWARARLRQALRPATERKAFSGVFRDNRALALAATPLWPALQPSGKAVRQLSLDEIFKVVDDKKKSVGYLVCPPEARAQLLAKRPIKHPTVDLCLVLPSEGAGRYFERLLGDDITHLKKLQAAVDAAVKGQADARFGNDLRRSAIRWVTFFAVAAVVALIVALQVNQPDCGGGQRQRCEQLFDQIAACAPEGKKPSARARTEFVTRCQQEYDGPHVKRARRCVSEHSDCPALRKCLIQKLDLDPGVDATAY